MGAVNDAPTLEAIADTDVDEQVELSFGAVGADQDLPADTLTYSLVGADHGASIDPGTGAFSWTPTEAQGGADYDFTVQVSDGPASATRIFTVTVNEVNVAPTLEAIADTDVDEQVELSFGAVGADQDLPADTLTYSLVGADHGAAIDPGTGVFSWTPTEAQGGADYDFTVQVSDGPASATAEFTVTVNEVNDAPSAEDKHRLCGRGRHQDIRHRRLRVLRPRRRAGQHTLVRRDHLAADRRESCFWVRMTSRWVTRCRRSTSSPGC